ncbi:MAG TPA: tetratricopeptide repeat protein, partial [Kofleriaceae bacterium]
GPTTQQPAAELPAPKGFFDDLPQPASTRGVSDVPAPKGFFDDLPQVKSKPSGVSDVPAPKGYFENVPGLPNASKPEVPAPKGYYENVPGLPNTSKPEVPAPKGYYENVPGLPNASKPEVPAPKGYYDNLPQAKIKKPPSDRFAELPLPPPRPSAEHLQLDDGHELDLISPEPAPGFDDLDLSAPEAPDAPTPSPARPPLQPAAEPGAARFGEPRMTSSPLPAVQSAPLELELEGQPAMLPAKVRPAPRPVKPVFDDAQTATRKAKRKQRLLGGLLAAAVLGGGGFFAYQRHAASVARQEAIAQQLQIARKSYAADDAKHWQRAANAARQVVELDGKNAEALGIGAETLLASALSDGTGAPGKLAQARKMLDAANEAGITSPQLTRARALSALVAKQPDGALGQLQPLASQAPKDGALALYLGWALAARGDNAGASKAFDTAAATPSTRLAALYGRGNAKLALADLEGARADFAAVLEADKDHIAAQVGLAAAEAPSASEQQEADLLAILARKDIAGADPRAVAQAWTRAGDLAMRAGRYDVARDRFKKALAAAPADLAATTGLAETELRDGKLPAASELAAQALAMAKDDVPAQLVQSELEVAERKLPIATQRLAAIAAHPTPLTPLEQARLQLITGRLLEAQGQDDDAIAAYIAGAKVARDLDLAPMMAAVDKLATAITAADNAKNAARADELRGKSDQLLGELAEQAEHDPKLAMRLGQAYLQSGAGDKAEPWLRKAVAGRPTDAEAKFQLGRALLKANKGDEALATLKAAMAVDPDRADIGVALARAYEANDRDPDAAALYAKLLTAKDPSLELRSRAGRFYARTGALAKAGQQGAAIVALDPDNAAGLYLKGEGLLAAGKAAEAKQAFQRASEVDHDPQYFDALGRAAEALAQGGDRELQDLALRSYQAAADAAPTMFSPLAGQGRLYVARHEAAKAVAPLLAAAKLDPRSAEVMYLIGASYQELQQSATALQWLEAAAKAAPDATTYWKIGQIYRDANQGGAAASALAAATRLAAEAEKKTGKPVPWLTDALYLRGRVALDLHDEAMARDAWQLYVARNPPPSAQLTEVKQQLATSLRGR